jgi:sensor histidine kinase YesM
MSTETTGIVLDAAPELEENAHRRGMRTRRLFWALIAALILLFWIVSWIAITVIRRSTMPDEPTSYLWSRAGASGFGFLCSLAILAAQWRLRRYNLRVRALAALGLAAVGALFHSAVNQLMFSLVMANFWESFAWSDIPIGSLNFIWSYLAVSAMILALAYGVDVSEREERITALQALAHAAQLRALRNQLNPHFLFNTLNSITSLISRGRNTEAERMTESLADFLRHTLALDPQRQITLGEEIQLQQLYLAIEKARFPDRLKVRMNVPDDLKTALVPNLITQPLIENSIKYAVARSSDPVELDVVAEAVNGRLELTIQDNGGNADAAPLKGSRVGLTNVSERLRVHYGSAGRLDADRREGGGFRNRITLPLHRAD